MSDELDIRGGGAIAVDTETLRTTAGGFVALAAELAELARLVGSAQSTLFTERAGTTDPSVLADRVADVLLAARFTSALKAMFSFLPSACSAKAPRIDSRDPA